MVESESSIASTECSFGSIGWSNLNCIDWMVDGMLYWIDRMDLYPRTEGLLDGRPSTRREKSVCGVVEAAAAAAFVSWVAAAASSTLCGVVEAAAVVSWVVDRRRVGAGPSLVWPLN